MRIAGRCHGGNIACELTWEPDPAAIPAAARRTHGVPPKPCGLAVHAFNGRDEALTWRLA
jgi:hypothetical protein